MWNILFIIAFFLVDYSVAFSAIISVSGTISEGESVSISGSGFGAKSPAAPVLWDQFEYGNNGDSLDTFPNWDSYIGDGGLIGTSQAYSGTRSAYNYMTVGGTNRDFYTSNFFFTPSETVFYSWRQRWDRSDTISGGITKYGRMNASPNRYNQVGNFAYSSGSLVTGGGLYFFTEPGTGYGFQEYVTLSRGAWHRVDMYSKLSSPAGTANGVNWFSVDSVDHNRTGEVNRDSGETFIQDNIILGIMFANVAGSGTAEAWVDDVYVDNTLARVEMCEGAAWASRGNCEIQIPTAWESDGTEITATINQGTFDAADTAYLYVVDAEGAVSDADSGAAGYQGYAVEIGGTAADTSAPTAAISQSDPQAITANSLTIIGTCTGDDVAGAKWRIGSAPDATHGTACTGTTDFSCDTSGYSVGANTLYVGCYDEVPNYGSDSITVNYTQASLIGSPSGSFTIH